ncbi:MAG: hypothetical protein EXR28_15610 [Betaproteobacteria bacterium]|nr:hypothetical protein [Betaproteobacteria bacterium]
MPSLPTRKDLQRLGKYSATAVMPTSVLSIRMRDGVRIAAALYLPRGGKGRAERYPTLLAASPYRFENNIAPALPVIPGLA